MWVFQLFLRILLLWAGGCPGLFFALFSSRAVLLAGRGAFQRFWRLLFGVLRCRPATVFSLVFALPFLWALWVSLGGLVFVFLPPAPSDFSAWENFSTFDAGRSLVLLLPFLWLLSPFSAPAWEYSPFPCLVWTRDECSSRAVARASFFATLRRVTGSNF